ITDDFLIRVAGLVERMLRVVVFPETVLQAIQTDLNELKIIPLRVPQIMAHNLEVFAAHAVYLILEPVFALSSKAFDFDGIFARQTGDLVLRRRRVRVIVFGGVRSQEAPHTQAVDFARRIRGWHTDDVGALALARHLIPDGKVLN